MPRSIGVFCSSSSEVDRQFADLTARLGTLIGQRGDALVYGGTDIGLMGILADSVRGGGGKVIGVIPQLLVDHGIADERCDDLVVTGDLRDRKTIMERRSEGLVALPGGFGTLEELAEMLALKLLGYHAKPIVLINFNGFYDTLLAFFEQLFQQRFAREKHRNIYQVAEGPEQALAFIDDACA